MSSLLTDHRIECIFTVAKDNPDIGVKKGDIGHKVQAVPFNKGTLNFPNPSFTALYLNQCKKNLLLSQEILETHLRTVLNKQVDIKYLYDYIEYFSASIIFGYTAIECFANHELGKDDKGDKDFSTTLAKKCTTSEKLSDLLAFKLAPRHPSKKIKKQKWWSKFRELETLRNSFIHLKFYDHKSSDSSTKNIFNSILPMTKKGSQSNFVLPLDPFSISLDYISFFYDENARPHWLQYYFDSPLS